MEHSSHAHPLPHGRAAPPREVSSSCTITSPQPSTLATSTSNDGLSHQARCLQLRNIGFRASVLPTRRISLLFGASTTGSEAYIRPMNTENSLSNANKRATYGEDLPPSPVNILQQLHNSAHRRKVSPRPGLGEIFQDSTSQNGQSSPGETSWYNETSNNCSPLAATGSSHDVSKLRELSGNERTPPSSSPPVKHVKGRRASRLKPRSSSFETTQHIDYLERELASAKARNESDASPAAKQRRSAKLRALSMENKNLRLELDELQQKGARVEEEVEKRLEFEVEMKDRLDALEAESEMKDVRIGDLEWEIECMKIKVKDAEGLEEVNADLEKRIDVLTNLLVQSPTWASSRSATTPPNKIDSTKRTPRPRSMLTKVPSSTGGVRLSLATVSETHSCAVQPRWPRYSDSTPAKFELLTDNDHSSTSPECLNSPSQTDAMLSAGDTEPSASQRCFDSRPQMSLSMRSAPSSSSRPTSFMSASSFGGAPWGIPILPEDDAAKASSKKRRMRRFASGSKSLKPLVLPTATRANSVPVSAPVYPSTEATAGRDFSHRSLDPTTSFLSKFASSSPFSTPTQLPRRPSTTESAREEAFRTLEGRGNCHAESPHSVEPPSILHQQCNSLRGGTSSQEPSRPRPRSLQQELDEVEDVDAKLKVSNEACDDPFEDGLIPATIDVTPESGQKLTGIEPSSSKEPTTNNRERQQGRNQASPITRNSQKESFESQAARIPAKGSPSLGFTSQQAHGIFARLTSLIFDCKQDPLVLAKGLLSNAWSLGSNRLLGGVGWWLLGLVYHRQRRKLEVECADLVAVDAKCDQPLLQRSRLQQQGNGNRLCEQGFQWPHFSAEASRERATKQHFRDYGATWLSPPHLHCNRNELPPFLPAATAHKTPHLFPCNDCVEPSSRRTLRLWFHFSLTIVLAVGMALKHGPAALLAELPARLSPEIERSNGRDEAEGSRETTKIQAGYIQRVRDFSGRSSKTDDSIADSAYGSIVFAEVLGPEDFEDR